MHPTEIPALVEALEAKVTSDPRSDVDKAYDEAVEILRDLREEWGGPMWGGVRAILDTAITRIVIRKEMSHG